MAVILSGPIEHGSNRGLCFVVNRFTHLPQREVVKNMMAVVIQNMQIVSLFEVTQDYIEMLSVALFNKIFRDFIGNVFFLYR